MSDERKLELLLNAYVRMVELKACKHGEHSHMLAYHTDFIKRQIAVVIKSKVVT